MVAIAHPLTIIFGQALRLFLFSIVCNTFGINVDQAYFQLGQSLKATGNNQEAFIYFQKAVTCNAQHTQALFEIAMHYYQQGSFESAFSHFEQVVQLDSHNLEATLHAGVCAMTLQKPQTAIEYYTKAVALDGRSAKAHFLLGVAYSAHGMQPQAIASLNTAVQLSPHSSQAHSYLATILRNTHQIPMALQHYEKALEYDPQQPSILFEKANALSLSGNTAQALELYHHLQNIHFDSPLLPYNMAYTYKKTEEYHKAIELYQQVLRHDPTHYQAHLGLAGAYLAQGNYGNGFKELAASAKIHLTEKPLLENIADATNKIILVTTSWNKEDMIQLLRFVPLLKQRGATIILQTDSFWLPLLSLCPYVDLCLLPEARTIPPFDMHIPLIALPALCLQDTQSLPLLIPYLTAPAFVTQHWRSHMQHDHTHYAVGIYWKNEEVFDDPAEDKTIAFKALADLADCEQLHLYALQPLSAQEKALLPLQGAITTIHTTMNLEKNLLAFASLIAALDMIITCDSLVAHIAGALGKPTILIPAQRASWRWVATHENQSDFYPTMHIIRNNAITDAALFEQIKKYITHYASSR